MHKGFSLVELSIVLVILGLLTGGILSGQSLIRAAQLRAVATEYQQYVTAVQAFRDEYMAIPGDFKDATRFWGTQHADPATCVTTASNSALTCNGDGDGLVEALATSANEYYRFWQHLANASLIEGTYSGITQGGTAISSVIGVNVPKSKLGNTGWSAYRFTTTDIAYGGDASGYALNYGNTLVFGTPFTNTVTLAQALKPQEIWNIDTKLDDGRPAYGNMVSYHWDYCTDAAAFSDFDSEYLVSDNSLQCAIIFRQAF